LDATELDQLKELTVVVADTGEFSQIPQFKPQDVTTNPSLIYKASQVDEYKHLVQEAVDYAKKNASAGSDADRLRLALDKVCVLFGKSVLGLIEGRVSSEVDARLSFDTEATIARVKHMKKLYEEEGIDTEKRVLFKIAATWQGIKAAEQLEKEKIHCNLTLIFSFAQAVACAEAGVTLISPFVGRILDFHKQKTGKDSFKATEDPGVLSVTRIYNYYKSHGYNTIVMGASFRNVDEVRQLAGCDYLTLAPKILDELKASTAKLPRVLGPAKDVKKSEDKVSFSESQFYWEMAQDECATVKLPEGIRGFTADIVKLEEVLKSLLQ